MSDAREDFEALTREHIKAADPDPDLARGTSDPWPCVCGSRMAKTPCICGGDDGYDGRNDE